MAYVVSKMPKIEDLDGLRRYVEEELLSIQRSTNIDLLQLNPSFSAPTKPRAGMIAYADGTSWNPGGGEGIYFRNAAGAWVKL